MQWTQSELREVMVVALAKFFFAFAWIWAWMVPAWCQAPGYRIAYNVCVDEEADDYEVFVMDMDGGNVRNLSQWKGVDWVYYAYGDRLFFISDRDAPHRKYRLYEMDANGGNLRKITDFFLEDSWLSGRKGAAELVVTAAVDGPRHELYLIDRQGRRLQRLTDNQIYENDPFFSPDGGQIVFRSKESGNDELWILNLASGKRRQLTHYPQGNRVPEQHGYHAGPPFWEPHRNLISFTSFQNGKYSLYAIKPDGSGLHMLVEMKGNQVYHAWSPDGAFLAFDSTDENGHYNVYLMNMADHAVRQLTHHQRLEQAPVFVLPPKEQSP